MLVQAVLVLLALQGSLLPGSEVLLLLLLLLVVVVH
jgi:hypothetical protein